MEYNESNFVYLKGTSIQKYYDELVKAEYICEYCPKITKMIIRKVLEGILKNIGEKNKIESNKGAWGLIKSINLSSNFSLPEEICSAIELVLVNGYNHTSNHNKNKQISKNSIEVLEAIHNILCWYLKSIEPESMLLIQDLSFKAPSNIEYKENELNKIKEEILLKDKQINNLRQKIIELDSKLNSIKGLNKIIIAIKEEKSQLEYIQLQLTKNLKEQKNQIVDIEKNCKIYMKKFKQLEESCLEIQELIFNTESRLVKAELQRQELKSAVSELGEEDEGIKRTEQALEDELKIIRKIYENLNDLAMEYQDTLETIEFSADKELQKILEAKIKSLTMQISFEDRIFNENILNYTRDVGEAKRRVRNFKELISEKINREMKYQPFYDGFLKLGNKELRIIYTISSNMKNISELISKSKELISKANEDKFLEAVNKSFNELKNISDYEIKLILYYKLIKLSQVSVGHIYNRKEFIYALDNIVDKAYEMLMLKKDFRGRIRKLDAISGYYLEKAIAYLKSKDSNLQINDELVDVIYKNIIEVKQKLENTDREKIYYDKFNLDNMSEIALKSSIKSEVFDFLSIMVDLGSFASYREIFNIIFKVGNLILKKSSVKTYGEILEMSFLNEYFIIILFLSNGAFLSQKQQEELLPLLVGSIISVQIMSDDYYDDLENYNVLLELWKKKQQKYNDIFIKKQDKENELEILIREKNELQTNFDILLNNYEAACENYNNYTEEFKQIIMNSEKRILLPSYLKYDTIRSKKEAAESHLDEAKNKLGTFKSILSPKVWKDQASKLMNESNMIELEKALIEEAKQKPYFKKDYEVFEQLKLKIQEANELIDKEKEKIKIKDMEINDIQIKIDELLRQLNNIKNAYLDMEEGYY